jgi:hypothetical protein
MLHILKTLMKEGKSSKSKLIIARLSRSSCDQATKGLRWIPRHRKAKKDVVTDETLWGAGSKL